MKNSKTITLCGISVALGSIALIFARFNLPVTLTLYVFSSIALMIPLTKGLIKGAILCYIATAIIAFITGNIIVLILYAFFFGLQPLLSALAKKFIKGKYAYVIGLVIKIVIFAVLYFIALNFVEILNLVPENIDLKLLVVLLCGVYIPYDYFMGFVQNSVKYYVNRFYKG